MIEFQYVPPDEMARRHQKSSRPQDAKAAASQRHPQQRNVESVLSLGDVRYFSFGPRVYRVPPVPYKLGQQALDAYTKTLELAREVVRTGQKEPADQYFKAMNRLVDMMWSHIRPTGKVRRCMWYLRLLRNPFRGGSEKEIKDVTDFFLQSRMTSSVRSISEAEVNR